MVSTIVKKIASKFRTYGGPVGGSTHPIDKALDGKPVVFALGVDVAEVVKMVLEESGCVKLKSAAAEVVHGYNCGMGASAMQLRFELLDDALKEIE